MIRWIGVGVIALGVIHVISAVVLYGPQLADLAVSGFGGLYSAPDDQNAGFWSVLFGVLAAAAGQQMYWSARKFGEISIVPGFFLLAVGIVGAWLVPIAPFWFAIVAGVLTILAARRPARAS